MATFGELLRPAEPYHVKPLYNYIGSGPGERKVLNPHFKDLISRHPELRRDMEGYGLKGRLRVHEASLLEWMERNRTPTNTPEFRQWFGQSVVKSQGEPKVVFHGTIIKAPKAFKYGFFRDTRVYPFRSFRSVGLDADIGYHFGNPEQALTRIGLHSSDNYVGKYVFAVYLSLQNPLNVSDLGDFKFMQMAEELHKRKLLTQAQLDDFKMYRAVYKEAKKMSEDYGLSEAERQKALSVVGEIKSTKSREIVRILRSKGHDGLAYYNKVEGGGISYAVFSPWQIKAVNNSGTWGRRNPDVFNGL